MPGAEGRLPAGSAARLAVAAAVGAAVAAGVVGLRAAGVLRGGPALLLAVALLVAAPTGAHLSRRLLLGLALVLGWMPVAWWVPFTPPGGRVGVLLAAVAGGLAGWAAAGPAGRLRRLVPRVAPVDALPAAAAAAAAWVVAPLLSVGTGDRALSLLLASGWDHSAHVDLVTGIRVHGSVLWAAGPAPDGSGWVLGDYPQHLHTVVAALTELTVGTGVGDAATEVLRYGRSLALVQVLTAALLAAGLCALPGLRRRPGAAAPLVALVTAGFVAGPGALALAAGYPNFTYAAALAGACALVALPPGRALVPLHAAALGGLLVGVAHGWVLLAPLAVAGCLPAVLPWRRRPAARRRGAGGGRGGAPPGAAPGTPGPAPSAGLTGPAAELAAGPAAGAVAAPAAGAAAPPGVAPGGGVRAGGVRAGGVRAGVLTAAVAAATAGACALSVRQLRGQSAGDVLTSGQGAPLDPFGLVLAVTAAAAAAALVAAGRTRGPARRAGVLVAVPAVAALVGAALAWMQLARTGGLSYYFWKYASGVLLVDLVVLAAALAALVPPARGAAGGGVPSPGPAAGGVLAAGGAGAAGGAVAAGGAGAGPQPTAPARAAGGAPAVRDPRAAPPRLRPAAVSVLLALAAVQAFGYVGPRAQELGVAEARGLRYRADAAVLTSGPSEPALRLLRGVPVAAGRPWGTVVYVAAGPENPPPTLADQWYRALTRTWSTARSAVDPLLFTVEEPLGADDAAAADLARLVLASGAWTVLVPPDRLPAVRAGVGAALAGRVVAW